jgi:signal transduction histidine kinase
MPLTIRSRLVMLSSALLLVLAATTGYLTHILADEAAATARAADMLAVADRASSARIAFGELRYWNTDLAVSQLTLAEQKAAAAREQMEKDLDRLAGQKPERIARVRAQLAEYAQFAGKAVDAYTNDQRVIGNSLLAQARQHSLILDELLGSIVTEVTADAIAARDQVVRESGSATRIAYAIFAAAVLGGALLTFLVLRSISVPLRALVAAMNGLIAGQTAVDIPPAGRDEIGAMARILALFRDTLNELRETLGRLKAAQANLVHAEKMASLGQLTAGIAHEIKNPLNFVNNFADLSVELLDEVKTATAPAVATLGSDERAEVDETMGMLTGNLEKIAEHGRRADSIVKSMLLHSRGGSADRQSVDINALVVEALNLAYHGARAQDPSFNITQDRDFGDNIAPIELVPQEITRVLLNLFGNGFYAANARSHETSDPAYRPALKISTRDLGGEVEIKVRDNGTGIAPEFRDKLFTPFFTTKPTGEGTGLGLSISYDIVTQQHGGTITVDSRVGEFTEFTIRLPRTAPTGAPAGDARTNSAAASGEA